MSSLFKFLKNNEQLLATKLGLNTGLNKHATVTTSADIVSSLLFMLARLLAMFTVENQLRS